MGILVISRVEDTDFCIVFRTKATWDSRKPASPAAVCTGQLQPKI